MAGSEFTGPLARLRSVADRFEGAPELAERGRASKEEPEYEPEDTEEPKEER